LRYPGNRTETYKQLDTLSLPPQLLWRRLLAQLRDRNRQLAKALTNKQTRNQKHRYSEAMQYRQDWLALSSWDGLARLGVDSAQGDSAHLDSARFDSAHLNSAQMATKVFFHRRSRQNRAMRDFGLADLSRCALQQISGPAGPLLAAVIILVHSVVFF